MMSSKLSLIVVTHNSEQVIDRCVEALDRSTVAPDQVIIVDSGSDDPSYLEDYRLIHCLRNGLPTDMNVYDAAAISAVCELTEISVANMSTPVAFPDFTRGQWKEWPRVDLES